MTYRVHLLEPSSSFDVEAGESVLSAALRAGVPLAYDCRFGGCGTCRIRLLEGKVEYEEPPMGLGDDEHEAGYALACQAHPTSDLVIDAARDEPCAQPARHWALLRSVIPLSPDVGHMSLEIPGIDALTYRPGQYLKLHAPDGSARSFSMASAPHHNIVDLHIRRIPGGRFTDGLMPSLRPGDRIEIELPLGNFFYRAADYRPLIMIATGTGLAPIKSILESLMDDPDCPPVSLYWGGRTTADLYLGEQIANWGERLYDFQYIPVLSRPDSGWTGRSGYVQDAVAADLEDLAEHAIYLCGSPTMIHDARRRFVDLGASAAHIYVDSFTFQSAGTPPSPTEDTTEVLRPHDTDDPEHIRARQA